MKTLHSTSPTLKISQTRESDRVILTLAGIMIAIICSLVLLYDTHSMGRITTKLFGENSMTVPTELPLEIKKFEVVSAIWLFR